MKKLLFTNPTTHLLTRQELDPWVMAADKLRDDTKPITVNNWLCRVQMQLEKSVRIYQQSRQESL